MQDTLQQRLEFVGLGAGVEARLAPIAVALERHLTPALERFQARVARSPSAARFLYGRDRIETSGEGLAEHWRALARGQFDAGFVEAAQRMGQRHARIGLEPRWHVGSYAGIVETLVKGVVHDGMAAALNARRGPLGLLAGGEQARLLAAADAMADGLTTLLGGVLLDLDLSVSGYVGKLREEASSAVEAQRLRLRHAVGQAGAALELAAQGRKDPGLQAPSDPDLAPLHLGAERLADTVIEMVADLETSSAALRALAGDLVKGGRLLVSARADHIRTCHELVAVLTDDAKAVETQGEAVESLSRRRKALARRCGGTRKSAGGVAARLRQLQAHTIEDTTAEQLDAMNLNVQLLAARCAGSSDAAPPSEEELRALGAALARLAAQWRDQQAQAAHMLADLTQQAEGLGAGIAHLTEELAAEAKAAASAARGGAQQSTGAGMAATMARALEQRLSADEAQGRRAQEMLGHALGAVEAFADLAVALDGGADERQANTEAAAFPAPDQAALAAHWHAG